MTLPILIVMLQLTFGVFNFKTPPDYLINRQDLKTSVITFNPAGMPVTINAAVADNSSTDAWLEYSITNLSPGQIAGIYLRVFVVDGSGKVITTVDGFSAGKIAAGTTLQSSAHIEHAIEQNGLSILAVTKVIGPSGVWELDPAEVERAIKAKISRQPDISLKVGFEPNRVVTNAERGEIFKLILKDLINDEEKSERLKDRANVIILKEDLHVDPPQIPNVKLSTLDQDEIQKIANKRGRVIYLIYNPLVVEGSRVLARISLRDKVAMRPGFYVPFKFTYLFTCVEKDGRWSIEKSLGYAQS